ncbi:hypothetical protein [Corallococcus sp. EGB]|uniref:hypothetical protein n=1 Tax=Corallococcus sp. EGB TaxID=1521117 RepID=UPI001CBE552B|nr:hypothetical protein [Corallococcus sp. EGB]
MSPRPLMPWLLLVALVTACASSPPEQRRRPPPRVLFESPLALLLEHHEELMLNTDQLIKIGQMDEALTAANKPLREQLREVWHPAPPPGGRPPPGTGMTGRNAPVGLGGRPPYRPPERPAAPLSEEDKKRQQAILQAMEDNEAAAYRQVEALLDEPQKVKARELLEKQREERARARESMQRPPEEPPAL